MNLTVISELRLFVRDAKALQAAAAKQVERAERMLEAFSGPAGGSSPETTPYKRKDGRMTDAGIAAINAAFDAGATVTEVSKQFDIQVSAASNRKKIWEVGRR